MRIVNFFLIFEIHVNCNWSVSNSFCPTASFSLPDEASEFKKLGILGQHLFFSSEHPDEGTDQLWQFDTQSKAFIELSTDSTFLVDFRLTPAGIFWLEKEQSNRFNDDSTPGGQAKPPATPARMGH